MTKKSKTMTNNGKRRGYIATVGVALAVIGWFATALWAEVIDRFDRIEVPLLTIQKTVGKLMTSTAVMQEQYEVLGLTVQDHERRIRRVELMPPWRGRDQ